MKISLNFPSDDGLAKISIEFEEGDHPMFAGADPDDFLDGMTMMGGMVCRGMRYL